MKPFFNCVGGLCPKMESFLVLVLHRSTSVKINTWYIKYKARCNERVVCLTYLPTVIFTWMQLVLVSHEDSVLAGGFHLQGCFGDLLYASLII